MTLTLVACGRRKRKKYKGRFLLVDFTAWISYDQVSMDWSSSVR